MKRNIVILLCLVFFTQTAFADWNIWCDDCLWARNTYRRERDDCYRNNGDCQRQHKNESARVKELETQNATCKRENDSRKKTVEYLLIGIGFLACICVGGGIIGGLHANNQRKQLKNRDEQIAQKDAQIQDMHNGLANMLHII